MKLNLGSNDKRKESGYMKTKFNPPQKKRRGVYLECYTCGKTFYVNPSRLKKNPKYCSTGCYDKNGKNNPFYNKKHSSESIKKMVDNPYRVRFPKGDKHPSKIRFNPELGFEGRSFKWWREYLLETIGKCQLCGFARKELLVCHHKDKNRKNNTKDNLILLCPNCHSSEHWFEGSGTYTQKKNKKEIIRLNLGCGNSFKEGYLGVDIIPGFSVDILSSADDLSEFQDESVDEILAEHLIEHMFHKQALSALKEWYRVLKFGGKITIECPDILELCKQFIEASNYKRFHSSGNYWALIYQIFGHQQGRTEEEQISQIHKTGFTEEYLRFLLNEMGFKEIKRIPHLKGPPETAVMRLEALK